MLQEGDVIQIEKGMNVNAEVPEHFIYANRKGSFSLVKGTVTINDELSYLTGKYVVYKTSFGGGSSSDGYPDGHHVFCESLDDGQKIDFYQSGCFTAMIEDIQPIGKAVRKWVIEYQTA